MTSRKHFGESGTAQNILALNYIGRQVLDFLNSSTNQFILRAVIFWHWKIEKLNHDKKITPEFCK